MVASVLAAIEPTSSYLPTCCPVASGVRSDIGWTGAGVGRGRAGVEPSLGLRAAPAAEGCVKSYRNVGGGGNRRTVRRYYHVV